MASLREWMPAGAGAICLGLGAGLLGIFGFFVPHLSEEFDVGAATLNIAPVAMLLVPGIVGPLIGKLVDRISIRLILFAGTALAMLSLVFISQAPTLVMAAIGFVGFALGVAMYGPVVVNGMLVKLYPGHEARALAIAAMGISAATAVLPPAAGLLLDSLSWRTALASVAGILLALLWVTIAAGLPVVRGASPDAQQRPERSLLRTRPFWYIGFCMALAFNASIILAICYPLLLQVTGYSAAAAGGLMALAGMAGLVGKFAVAALGDSARSQVKWLAGALLCLQIVGMVMLLIASEPSPLVWVAMVLAGAGTGGFLPMHPYLNSRYFSADVIGEVSGAQMPLFLPFGLIGPPLAGWSYDQFGDYQWVLIGICILLVIAVGLVALLPRPVDSAVPEAA